MPEIHPLASRYISLSKPSTQWRHKFTQNIFSCLELHLRVLTLDPPKALQVIKKHKFAQNTFCCLEIQLWVSTPTHRKPYNSVNHKFAQNTSSCLEIRLRVLILDPPKALQLTKQHKFAQNSFPCTEIHLRVLALDPRKALQFNGQHKFAQNTFSWLVVHLRVWNLDPPKALQSSKKHKFAQNTSCFQIHLRVLTLGPQLSKQQLLKMLLLASSLNPRPAEGFTIK